MIIFTFIILLSSAYRMNLYENTYGYTLLRLLVYCSLFTESTLLIPTIFYIIDINIDLAKIYFTIIVSVYVCMNFANFDNIIAKRNIDRYIETGKIDMYYLKEKTGTDAIKQMMRILEKNNNNTVDNIGEETLRYIENTYDLLSKEKMDFRNFNISKIYAERLIKNNIK